MLTNVIEHTRGDVSKVNDPKAQALFESTDEVLLTLTSATSSYISVVEKLAAMLLSGKTTFIYWENLTISNDSIISATQDSALRRFAIEICPNTIVALFHVMNPNKSPVVWSCGKEVLAWRQIHDIIGNKVKYAWVVNDTSIPNVKGSRWIITRAMIS